MYKHLTYFDSQSLSLYPFFYVHLSLYQIPYHTCSFRVVTDPFITNTTLKFSPYSGTEHGGFYVEILCTKNESSDRVSDNFTDVYRLRKKNTTLTCVTYNSGQVELIRLYY